MKILFLFQLFIFFVFLGSCKNAQENQTNNVKKSEKSDSVKKLNNAIYLSDKYEKAAIDSIKQYGLTELADSCLMYFYVVNCMKKISDDLWCKDNSLTIGESDVKLIGFVNKDLDQKKILFGVFLNDSIPCSIELKTQEHPILIAFTVSVKKKRATEVWIGQYTKVDFNDFKIHYDSIVSSNDLKNYLHSKGNIIHPTFKRFINEIRY